MDDSKLIRVYKISYDGAHYYDIDEPYLKYMEIGTTITVEEITWDEYYNLEEFQGF